ncbi:type II toxin-antitoxin system Phd/YefM family antitoxin [Leucobacter sp. wl10]|nr:type II toxin-antitoxin system Phd/YefM family antitoxin [Leucobacter sp. wl10]
MNAISAREFNRDVSAAKRAALEGPLVITDRGNPAFVLISIAEYRKMCGASSGQALLDRLSMDDDFDFEPEPVRGFARAAQF